MGKLLYLFRYLRERWREPSTHSALSAICLSFGVQLPESVIGHWFTVFGLVFGALGVFVKEGAPETKL